MMQKQESRKNQAKRVMSRPQRVMLALLTVLLYAALLLLVIAFYSGGGEFIYEGF